MDSLNCGAIYRAANGCVPRIIRQIMEVGPLAHQGVGRGARRWREEEHPDPPPREMRVFHLAG